MNSGRKVKGNRKLARSKREDAEGSGQWAVGSWQLAVGKKKEEKKQEGINRW